MTEAGFTKNGDDLWEKDGADRQRHHPRLRRHPQRHRAGPGGNAAERRLRRRVNFGTDAYQNMADGKPGLYMFGHGASLKDPYAAFELFHSRYSAADRHHRRQQPLLALQEPGVRRSCSTTMAPLSARTIRSSRRTRPRRWRSTGATRSTSRSSSGCTASPTTRPTGPTGRRRPTWPWAPTAPSGRTPACWSSPQLKAAQ